MLQTFLIFITNVIPMNRFITNDQTNEIGGIGQFAAAGKIHWQPEARIEQEGFQKHAGYFFLQRFVVGIMCQNDLRFALERGIFLTPGVGSIHVFGLAKGREY